MFIWDLDGVIIPGRGTTHLANHHDEGDPGYFRERFLEECGQEGPLKEINRDDLYRGFGEWESKYGAIDSIGKLAQCLTDMRHKLKVFPSSEQTIYTKNMALEGLELTRIAEIAGLLTYTDGFREAVEMLGEEQVLFSNSNWALVDAVARKFGFVYNEGAPPVTTAGVYRPELYRGNASLTGEMRPYQKMGRVLVYLDDKDMSTVAAIDDTEIEMLKALRERGARVFGFYNEADPDMKEKDLRKMKETGICVVRDNLRGLI
jgi:hypothetical protein